MLAVREPQTVAMTMPDGVTLAADVYRPVASGVLPVLVMRQPYGRRIASTVVLAHPAWYAAQGYVVLVQDVRGRGDSGGDFRILEDDVDDGAATLALAADLAGGNGQVATYGFSYQGMTQFMALAGAARAGTKRPDAMAVAMAAWDVRNDWAFEGDAFRLEANQRWACQMAAENARRAGDHEAAHALRAATGALGSGPVSARLDVFDRASRHTHYHDWLADDPAYWRRVSPASALAGVALDVPTLHVGGWLDVMLPGTFAAFSAFAAHCDRQRLLVGPWAHLPWGRRIGSLDAGRAAADGIDPGIVAFFDWILKGRDEPRPAVRLFDLGTKSYSGFDRLPDTNGLTLHLASTGRAAPSSVDGLLVAEAPAPGLDRIVHDPWRPAPSVGLHLGTPPGFVDRVAVDDRGDVAVFTSAPLDRPLVLAGSPTVELHVDCDRPSFDLDCTLSVVDADGSALAVTSGHVSLRAAPASAATVLPLRRTLITVPAGRRLRLSIQAAAFPAFAVNPGTSARPEDAALADALVTTLVVHHGGTRASALHLPVLDDPDGAVGTARLRRNDDMQAHVPAAKRTTVRRRNMRGVRQIDAFSDPVGPEKAAIDHETLLRHAFRVAGRARAKGNMPFGAILAGPAGDVLIESENGYHPDHDATAHAERLLATEASKHYRAAFLAECTMYSSTEPCAMCAGALYWAGIGRLVYGLPEARLKTLTGDHADNPTMDLSCRTVLAAGQRQIEVIGPFLEEEAAALHNDAWKPPE